MPLLLFVTKFCFLFLFAIKEKHLINFISGIQGNENLSFLGVGCIEDT